MIRKSGNRFSLGTNAKRLPGDHAQIKRQQPESGSTRLSLTLVVVGEHPADGGETDNHRNRDRPGADADVADGLAFGLVFGDLAIACLVVFFRFVHRLIPIQVLVLVDGRKGTSNDAVRAAPLLLPPMPASRLKENAASAAHSAAAAAAMKTDPVLHFMASSAPPTRGPTIEPIRPIPSAQPTPVALTAVG